MPTRCPGARAQDAGVQRQAPAAAVVLDQRAVGGHDARLLPFQSGSGIASYRGSLGRWPPWAVTHPARTPRPGRKCSAVLRGAAARLRRWEWSVRYAE